MAATNRLVWLAIVIALAYCFTWSWRETVPLILLKGTPVALLAVHCAITVRGVRRWPLTAIFAFGSIGDMLLQFNLVVGAAAFSVGHIIAIWLYRQHADADVSIATRRRGLAIVLIGLLITAIFALLPIIQSSASLGDNGPKVALALAAIVYILIVGAMAVSLWASAFRHGVAALGALYFLVSDVLIVGRMEMLAKTPLINEDIWALYVGAQVLICLGVVSGLRDPNAYGESQRVTAAIGNAP